MDCKIDPLASWEVLENCESYQKSNPNPTKSKQNLIKSSQTESNPSKNRIKPKQNRAKIKSKPKSSRNPADSQPKASRIQSKILVNEILAWSPRHMESAESQPRTS